MIGVHNPTPKLQSLLSQEKLKLRTANLADTFTGSKHKPMKNFGEKGAWGIQGLPKFFECLLFSQERVKLRTSNLAGTFTGSIRTKVHYKFFWKKAWAYPGTANFFSVTSIIPGTGKATNFKLYLAHRAVVFAIAQPSS